jgi:hypothetical protein
VYVDENVGTAFVVARGRGKPPFEHVAALATARHVADPARTGFVESLALVSSDLKRRYPSSENPMKIQSLGEEGYDTSVILVHSRDEIISREAVMPMLPWSSMLRRGADIAWLGFPAIFEPELCFFHGFISGFRANPPTYLVDGTAMPGVSGGPAFDNRAHLIGLVSAYIPHAQAGEPILPGVLSVVPINLIGRYAETTLKAKLFA